MPLPVESKQFTPCSALVLLSKCKSSSDAKQLHGCLIKTGLIRNASLTTKIILALARSPHDPLVDFARGLFFTHHAFSLEHGSNSLDPFLWNIIIKSFSHGNDPVRALSVFCLMLENRICFDKFSVSLVLKACSRMGLLNAGMQFHALLVKSVFASDMFLLNCLIMMYKRCGFLNLAFQVFQRMEKRDSVSYNLMIDGYVKLGKTDLAWELFERMPTEDKDLTTWNSLISGYVNKESEIDLACKLFEEMPSRDLISWNLMVEAYSKCGKMADAQGLFDSMPKRDLVSWANIIYGYLKVGQVNQAKVLFDSMPERDVVVCNIMIGGFLLNGYAMEALEFFHWMYGETNLLPDDITLSVALSAAARLGRLDKGIGIHCYIIENGLSLEGRLGVALIDMYSKCGSIEKAILIFERLDSLRVDHFNAMIGGLAIHGMGGLAFDLLMEMKRRSILPDDITFIGLLSACGHAGLVKEGIICFEIMRRIYNFHPQLQHFGCLVDILCRSGKIEVASKLVEEMPFKPNDIILKTLLSPCRNRDELMVDEPVAKHLSTLGSSNPSSYVIMSNMCAVLGMWSEVSRVRSKMRDRKLLKVPGCSWMEIEGNIHEFLAQASSHPQASQVYSLLDNIIR